MSVDDVSGELTNSMAATEACSVVREIVAVNR